MTVYVLLEKNLDDRVTIHSVHRDFVKAAELMQKFNDTFTTLEFTIEPHEVKE
jgi:hypothetical protein